MRTVIVKVLIVLTGLGAAAGCAPRNRPPRVEWAQQEADLGPVKQGAEAVHAFRFTNVGTQPLLIREVKPSCGCTLVDWPRQFIQPGQKGEVRVRYRASPDLAGEELRHVTVLANTEPGFTHLYLKARIVP
jgi:hypothetical protein